MRDRRRPRRRAQIPADFTHDLCHELQMTEISYRVVPRGKGGFDVEMERPDGRKRTVPGFVSEHEADAWIVQAKRMIRDAGPWTPLAPRKPAAVVSGQPPKLVAVAPAPAEAAPPNQEPLRRTSAARPKAKAVPESADAAG